MSCKTIAKYYIDSSTPVTVGANTAITFAHGVSANKCLVYYSNGSVKVNAKGLYIVSFNATPIATAVGDVQATLLVNNQAVLGASSADSLAVIGDAGSFSFLLPISLDCNDTLSVLNVTSTSYTVANLVIIKVG